MAKTPGRSPYGGSNPGVVPCKTLDRGRTDPIFCAKESPMTAATMHPLAPGDPAPYFELPAVAGSDTVSLADYTGRSPLFLALMVSLWCPFCRRQLVRLGAFEDKLKALGVESLAVVATEPENARRYFKFRPTRLRL